VFIVKNCDVTSWHEFCTGSARFALCFIMQPNDPECTQIVRNAPKRLFMVQWGGSDAFIVKNSDATLWHKLLHYFGLFYTEFRKATKRSRMQTNSTKAPKCQFRIQCTGLGAFVAKDSNATSWHELLHYFGPFCSEFCKATKRSRMHPNRTKRTKTSGWGPMGRIGCIRCKKF
jgi:hypothetical protein